MRRRYKLAHWASVLVGGLVAAILIAAAFANLTARKLAPDQTFYASALLVLVIGFGLPWLLVKVLWLWKRRRHDWGRSQLRREGDKPRARAGRRRR